ncbi:hypothetical protein Tco_1135612 [Tanacetum coccineum]
MNPIATQQAALDNALVPSEKKLKIERCNARIAFSKPQKEETYQFTLEALKLSPCYPAFVITTEVLKIYMHQFWTTIKKIEDLDAYNFKLEKKKFRVDTEVFYVICYLQFTLIKCTNHGEHLMQSSIGASLGKQHDLIDSGNYELKSCRILVLTRLTTTLLLEMFLPGKLGSIKKVASPSRKLSPIKEAKPVKKAKRVKRPAKKSTTAPTAGVAIRDTPGVHVSKKKARAKDDRSKGGPDEQQRKTSGTDEGSGTKLGVPDVPTYNSKSKNESWGDSEEDNDNESDNDSKVNDDKANNDDDGMDKTKITRKPSKTVKHQAREWKSVQEPEAKVKKSKLSVNYGSTKVNHKKTKPQKVPNQSFKFQKITQMVLEV